LFWLKQPYRILQEKRRFVQNTKTIPNPNIKNEETFEVNVISIDEYFKNKEIKEIHRMKIDTEGFDASVLFGSNL